MCMVYSLSNASPEVNPMFLDALLDTVIDSLKLLPFLFAAYLVIEIIEDRAEEKTVALINRAGRWGPVAGAALGVALGAVLAGAAHRLLWLDALLSPMLTLIRSTPVASFILLLLIWLGRDILPSVIVVLMVLPIVWGAVRGGLAAADPLLLEMAKVCRLGPWRTLRRIWIPTVM